MLKCILLVIVFYESILANKLPDLEAPMVCSMTNGKKFSVHWVEKSNMYIIDNKYKVFYKGWDNTQYCDVYSNKSYTYRFFDCEDGCKYNLNMTSIYGDNLNGNCIWKK